MWHHCVTFFTSLDDNLLPGDDVLNRNVYQTNNKNCARCFNSCIIVKLNNVWHHCLTFFTSLDDSLLPGDDVLILKSDEIFQHRLISRQSFYNDFIYLLLVLPSRQEFRFDEINANQ